MIPLARCMDGSGSMQSLPTILVVEDDLLIQSVVEEALTEAGFEIVIASTGELAAELLEGGPAANTARLSPISISAATAWRAGRWPAAPERSIRHSPSSI